MSTRSVLLLATVLVLFVAGTANAQLAPPPKAPCDATCVAPKAPSTPEPGGQPTIGPQSPVSGGGGGACGYALFEEALFCGMEMFSKADEDVCQDMIDFVEQACH